MSQTESQTTETTQEESLLFRPEAVSQHITAVRERGTIDFSMLFEAIGKALGVDVSEEQAQTTPESDASEVEEDQGYTPPDWFEAHPKRREDLSVNVIGDKMGLQFDRILHASKPGHEVNDDAFDEASVKAAYELGILSDDTGHGSTIDLEALREVSAKQWEGVTEYTHIDSLSEHSIAYIQTMLMDTGFLDAEAHGPADGVIGGPESLTRKAAVEAGILSSDGSLRPHALREMDHYYIESEFLRYAPVQRAEAPAATTEPVAEAETGRETTAEEVAATTEQPEAETLVDNSVEAQANAAVSQNETEVETTDPEALDGEALLTSFNVPGAPAQRTALTVT